MAQSRGTGIVLSRTLSGEADCICNIFTRELGKERFIFKGLRKSKKRPGTAAEPGTSLRMIYYSSLNSNIHTVSDLEVVSSHPGTRERSDRIFAQYYAVELIDRTTGFGVPEEKLYQLLSSGLDTLEKTDNVMEFTIFYSLRLLAVHGLLPGFSRCSGCGRENPFQFSISRENMKILCPDCSAGGDIMLCGECRMFMNECMTRKFNALSTDSYRGEDFPLLLSSITDFIENYFSIKIKSGKMLPSVLRVR